ncbi:hypothetical protein LIER_17555 [Lithospermum erythrorhizon]|uniref:Uncharacterized protein n=1 Tax=Lithospermum erythrorhizon TaxID=34254 RepID=A0AAV3QC29_LITER
MKFPTPRGIGQICGDQKKARICYQTSLPPLNKGKTEQGKKRNRENHREVNAIRNEEEADNSPKERENEKKGEPHEEVELIPFKQGKADRTFRIGTKLREGHKQRLIALVREYADVFAWGNEDMPEIDRKVVVHKLYVDPTFQPITQKKWVFNDEKRKAIREEVQTLLKASAIHELKFRNWIGNVVSVKKPNNKWRMCTDFKSMQGDGDKSTYNSGVCVKGSCYQDDDHVDYYGVLEEI